MNYKNLLTFVQWDLTHHTLMRIESNRFANIQKFDELLVTFLTSKFGTNINLYLDRKEISDDK